MKVFRVYFSYLNKGLCVEYVVSDKEKGVTDILLKRHNISKADIKNLRCEEVSIESVYLRNLTAGDLLRLINN